MSFDPPLNRSIDKYKLPGINDEVWFNTLAYTSNRISSQANQTHCTRLTAPAQQQHMGLHTVSASSTFFKEWNPVTPPFGTTHFSTRYPFAYPWAIYAKY